MQGKSGRITTHVLDVGTGQPAIGLALELKRLDGPHWTSLGHHRTNEDGRCGGPLLEGSDMQPGTYEILFQAGAWRGDASGFYDEIAIRFVVNNPEAHHHVPLILAPFGYSTYRGS